MKNLLLALLLIVPFAQVLAQEEEEPEYHIKSIFFGGGSYYIDEQQAQELFDWLDSFENIHEYEISIQSHTDNIGSMEYNKWLSQMRGRSTLQLLNQKGIPPEMISNEDFGENSPVYDNATWEGKLRNRRVDVILRRIVM